MTEKDSMTWRRSTRSKLIVRIRVTKKQESPGTTVNAGMQRSWPTRFAWPPAQLMTI